MRRKAVTCRPWCDRACQDIAVPYCGRPADTSLSPSSKTRAARVVGSGPGKQADLVRIAPREITTPGCGPDGNLRVGRCWTSVEGIWRECLLLYGANRSSLMLTHGH